MAGHDLDINQQDLLAYLRAYPEALTDLIASHPELLDNFARPGLSGDGALVDFQQQRILALNKALDHRTNLQDELIDTSRSNLQTQLQVHDAVLDIIRCRDLESLIGFISRDMSHDLRLDCAILCVEPRGPKILPIREPIMSVKPGSISTVFQDGSTALLGAAQDHTRSFFGPAASLVQSHALIRLMINEAPTAVMLALGDRDPDKFHKGQATHLLRFLGDVLALRLEQFMADSNAEKTAQWSSPETP